MSESEINASKRPWLIAAGVGAVLVLAATIAFAIGSGMARDAGQANAGAPTWQSPTALVAVSGSIRVSMPGRSGTKDAPCDNGVKYIDVHTGATVTITDSAGKVLAIAELAQGKVVPDEALGDFVNDCKLPFTAQVPAGVGPYGFEIGRHGVVRFDESAVHKADMNLD